MRYILNGYDLEEDFGIIVNNGVFPLLAFPERKGSTTNNFEDEDGDDIDLNDPHFQARTFQFDCTQKAPTIEELTELNFAFYTQIKKGGVYPLYNDYINKTIWVYYQKQTPKGNTIYETSEGGVAIDYLLQMKETVAGASMPDVYLVDHLNRYLIP